MNGKLYMVATPIGNLGDISFRALETLKSVKLILAEDTRVTRKLLTRYEISTPFESYHQHSDITKKLYILNKLLNGEDIALVTDAGTPGISDPGNELVDFLLSSTSEKLDIIPIPGPSSLTAVLSVCGFNVSHFLFLGFLSKRDILIDLDIVGRSNISCVYYDSPFRMLKNLEKLVDFVGPDRRVLVSFELTKMHEKHFRGRISEVLETLQNESNLKGEVVVVVEGKSL